MFPVLTVLASHMARKRILEPVHCAYQVFEPQIWFWYVKLKL